MSQVSKAVLATLAAVVAIVAIIAGSYYGGIFGEHVKANYQKRVVTNQVQQAVRTKEFAQSAYEAFFKDCNDTVAMNAQIVAATTRVDSMKALPDDSFGTKAQKIGDAISDLTGLQQGQASIAARYNANAAEYTRGQFRDENLPARLDPPYDYTCQ